jgi:hypothetical protein
MQESSEEISKILKADATTEAKSELDKEIEEISKKEQRKIELEKLRRRFDHERELAKIQDYLRLKQLKKKICDEELQKRYSELIKNRDWAAISAEEQEKIQQEMEDLEDDINDVLDRQD